MGMRFFKSLNRFRQYLRRAPQRQRPEKFVRRPTLEVLEDRLVLSTATQVLSTLNITADPGTATNVRSILMEVDATDPTKLDVLDTGTVLGKFTISSISNVNVNVAGNDASKVDDSNGLPFAPGTAISLAGTGPNNSLALLGSLALNLNGNEVFTAGTAAIPGSLSLGTGFGSVVFTFSSTIASVTDDLSTTQLIVQARGQAVSQVGPNSITERLKGLAGAGGAGNTLTFRDKASVILDLNSDNASANLNATAAPIGLTDFGVDVFGKNDKVIIGATPSTVRTTVVIAGAQNDSVNLQGNSGPVTLFCNNTTVVDLGSNITDSSKSLTSGIKNTVTVIAAEILNILDGGNGTTQENMTVTESTISGTGMFGNNGVVVHYEETVPTFETGRLANTYTVADSHPGATFFSGVSINDDFSNAGLSVQVSVDSGSALHLSLFNKDPASGSLFISTVSGTFNPPAPTTPDGSETVTFTSGSTSTVFYEGFNSVGL
jgi:hypothetical protein